MTNGVAELTTEETGLFMEIFEASLRIHQRDQLFSWLQGSFQYLFPHEVLVCCMRFQHQPGLHFESFISTRYVKQQQVQQATQHDQALIQRVIMAWRRSRRPILIADGLSVGDFGSHLVPFCERPGALRELELNNIAAHGMTSEDGDVLSFFSFSRVPGQLGARHAYLLQLLVPHLHAVLNRITASHYLRNNSGLKRLTRGGVPSNAITQREHEVMRWMNGGRTNQEIAAILNISPLTVKNHVHSILSKLGVQNRNNACQKASQLGLLKS